MFISFLLPYIDRGQGPIFHCFIAPQVARLGFEEVILIADERYFASPLEWGQEQTRFGIGYKTPIESEWGRVRRIEIPLEVFADLDAGTSSCLEAFRVLLTTEYQPLRKALETIFKQICREFQPEGVLTWCNVPSLEMVAAAHNLPVIHNELGPFRNPNYQGTIYFDFKGVNGNTSAAGDMIVFLEEIRRHDNFVPLGLEEIRNLLMKDSSRTLQPIPPRYRRGVALQVEDDSNLLAFSSGMTNFELIFVAQKGAQPEEILIRQHPHGHLDYGSKFGIQDKSADSIEFISLCEQIYCTNSSVAFEALLLEKPVHILGDSPAACISQERVSQLSAEEFLLCLNYLFLCYLVPDACLWDCDYYRWRLHRPSLIEIYEKHLAFYRRR